MTPEQAADITFDDAAMETAAALIGRLRRFAFEVEPRDLVALAASLHPDVELADATSKLSEGWCATMTGANLKGIEVKAAIELFEANTKDDGRKAIDLFYRLTAERNQLRITSARALEDRRAKIKKLEGILSASQLALIAAEPLPDYSERLALLDDRIGQLETYIRSGRRAQLPEFVDLELKGGQQ